jgi:hypothetical protein
MFGPDETLKGFNCIDLTVCILDSFFPLGYQKTCQMFARKLDSQLSKEQTITDLLTCNYMY